MNEQEARELIEEFSKTLNSEWGEFKPDDETGAAKLHARCLKYLAAEAATSEES